MKLMIVVELQVLIFYMIIKQKQVRHAQMELHPVLTHRQYEDIQIQSTNCCTPFARASTSIDHIRSTQKLERGSKQKGIKLTRKPKSFSKLQSSVRLEIKRSQPLKLQPKTSKKQQENSPLSSNIQSLSSQSKKSFFVQKCIDYKNKKIIEHKHEEVEHSHSRLEVSAKEELFSTCRNTARTLTSSFGVPLHEKHCFTNNIPVEQSIFKYISDQKSEAHEDMGESSKKAKKTLERIFEETQGKRIITLESQNEQNSNEYSVAESFIFNIGKI